MKTLRLAAVLTSLLAISCATAPTAPPPATTTAAATEPPPAAPAPPAPAARAVSGLTVPVDY